MKRLQDRTAIITGAASGIGRATARSLAERGCHIALVDVDQSGLDETRRIIEEGPNDVTVAHWEVDVSDAAAIETLADRVVEYFGSAHILINNAGINVTALFDEHSLDDFRHTMDVNFWGVVHGCRSFLPYLLEAEEAHIVNISSVLGIVGAAGQAAYSASKFAVRGLSESLHEELHSTSVDVSVVHPGCINTRIVKDATYGDEAIGEKIQTFFEDNGCAPSTVAERIVAAIDEGRHRVLVTSEAYLVDWARRLFPTLGNRLAHRLMARRTGLEFKR